jgi:hypothetical protein
LLCGLGRRTVTRVIGFNNRQHLDWSADYKLFHAVDGSQPSSESHYSPPPQGCDRAVIFIHGPYKGGLLKPITNKRKQNTFEPMKPLRKKGFVIQYEH